MLLFIATVIDQLDLALEHLAKEDIHNARFGLMLTDNAIELVLHRIAKDKKDHLKETSWKCEAYEHQKELDQALQKFFYYKTKFARLSGSIIAEEARAINIMHEFRNEAYHAGLVHEKILPSLSTFYFSVGCAVIGRYKPRYLWWRSSQLLPERALKFRPEDKTLPGGLLDLRASCSTLSQACGFEPKKLIATLADQMDAVVSDQDTSIGIISDGVYESQRTTRDRAVIDCQAWPHGGLRPRKDYCGANWLATPACSSS